MKRAILFLSVAFLCNSVFGQGTIKFNNRTGPIDVPVSRPDGTGAGAGVTAQLFLLNGGLYTPLLPTATFRTTSPAAEYYINEPATAVVVPGIPGGQPATVVLRAYEGATFESSTLYWESNPVTVLLGGDVPGSAPIPDALLIGLNEFIFVPEPSTIALGLFGAAALLYRRRS